MAVNRGVHQPLVPPPNGAAVRLYRQGLGDCLLIAIATKDASKPSYMLVDCGVHVAQTAGQRNIELILEDLIAVTSGQLDVLVATHEHIDHLSAFARHADILNSKRLKIDELWLAWTEDPKDSKAKAFRVQQKSVRRALAEAQQRLERTPNDRRNLALRNMLAETLKGLGAQERDEGRTDSKPTQCEVALAALKRGARQVRYLRPTDPPRRVRETTAHAYTLGPPSDKNYLRKSDPSHGNGKETYLSSLDGLESVTAALMFATDASEANTREQCQPFSAEYRISQEDAEFHSFFRQYYEAPGEAWRRIDTEWIGAAEQLALHLDRHTNNTSVAIALEVGPSTARRVLLLPGDAQVGNWLSWGNLRWKSKRRELNLQDLLARVVFYKAGHHASHNGTLKRDASGAPYGLELMPAGIVSFIPVDEAIAQKLPGWNMPDPRLYDALLRKTGGNLLRADEAHGAAVPPLKRSAIPGVQGTAWRRSRLRKAGDKTSLYYDLFFR